MDILKAAIAEERHLLERLEAVRAVIQAYGPRDSTAVPVYERGAVIPRVRATRVPSAATTRIKALLADLLRGCASPTPTRDLLQFLESEGINVGGKNPIATLSALLSHASEFEAVGRQGWLLKSEWPEAPTSGLALTDEAPASFIESLAGETQPD